MDIAEAYEMMAGMCGDKEGVKIERCECQDTRDLPLEDESKLIYVGLKQTQLLNCKYW